MLLKGRYPVPAPDEPNIRPPGSLQQLTPYMSIVLHTPTPYMPILHLLPTYLPTYLLPSTYAFYEDTLHTYM